MNYDRVILDLINRVSILEEKINNMGNTNSHHIRTGNFRDTTKYIFNGNIYGKNKLVYSVIKNYVKNNPRITAEELIKIFDKSLQGSFGVIRMFEDVKENYPDYERRFFCQKEEIINTVTSKCVICSQWGIGNINNFITRCDQLGINITKVN